MRNVKFILATLGEEWRSKWMLEKRWQTASTDELIRGMNDINDHVRLAAVAACNKAAELRQRKKAEQSFGKNNYETCRIASPCWRGAWDKTFPFQSPNDVIIVKWEKRC